MTMRHKRMCCVCKFDYATAGVLGMELVCKACAKLDWDLIQCTKCGKQGIQSMDANGCYCDDCDPERYGPQCTVCKASLTDRWEIANDMCSACDRAADEVAERTCDICGCITGSSISSICGVCQRYEVI